MNVLYRIVAREFVPCLPQRTAITRLLWSMLSGSGRWMRWHKIEGQGLLLQASGKQSYQRRKSEMSFQNQIWNGWITIILLKTHVMPDNFFQTIHFKTGISLGLTALTLSLCLVDTWDPMSTVVRWDVSTLLFPNMHHQTCSLTTWHYLSLSSTLIIGIILCLVVSLDKSSSSCLRNLSQQWSWQPYVYCILFSDACRI